MTTIDSSPPLQGFQRKALRSMAHDRKPMVLVGEAGITDAIVAALDEALLRHELVKVRLRQPDDKRTMAQELATRSGSELCGLVGHTVILYRPHPEEPRIQVPSR